MTAGGAVFGRLAEVLVAARDENSRVRPGRIGPSEWTDIAALARRHRVGPLLYRDLRRKAWPIPAGAMDELADLYHVHLRRNLRLYRALAAIVTDFRNAGLPVLVLKGAHLAEGVYGNPGVRPMSDIDLLAAKGDLGGVERRLKGLGFRAAAALGRLPQDIEAKISKELPEYIHPSGVRVDVHWTIADPGDVAIDGQGLWARSVRVSLGGAEAAGLCPEDLILHIALHAIRHDKLEAGLLALCDIREIVAAAGAGLDWTALTMRAREWKAGNGVGLALRLARDLLAVPVPDEILAALPPGGVDERIVRLAMEKMASGARRDASLTPNLRLLWSRRPFHVKLTRYLRSLFPARAEMARMYPAAASAFFWLYYPVRIVDLFHRYGVKNVVRQYAGSLTRVRGRQNHRPEQLRGEYELADWLEAA